MWEPVVAYLHLHLTHLADTYPKQLYLSEERYSSLSTVGTVRMFMQLQNNVQ